MKRTKEKLYSWIEVLQASGYDISINRRNNYYAIETKDQSNLYQAGLNLNEVYIWCEAFVKGYEQAKEKFGNVA